MKCYNHESGVSQRTNASASAPRRAGFSVGTRGSCTGKGDYDPAIQDFNKAIELAPNDAELYNNRAEVYLNKLEYDKAWKDIKKIKELGGLVDSESIEALQDASKQDEK